MPLWMASMSAYSSSSFDGSSCENVSLKFGASVGEFNETLEDEVVAGGWYKERPSKTVSRSYVRAAAEVVIGAVLAFLGFQIPASGLLVLGVAITAAGIVTFVLAQVMPTVTMPGAMIRAMLAAYRRTLENTMAQARSMQQVVDEAKLGWLETPDQAVVWGTALGLQGQIEQVLKRSLEDVQSGAAQRGATWFPAWYGSSGGGSGATAGAVAGGSMFSASALPNFNGMFSVLGTVGNSPGSSGGGGGGGFGGGASGGF